MVIVAGYRHPWYPGPPPGGQEHYRDAGYHRPRPSPRRRPLLHGPERAVRPPAGAAEESVRLHQASVRQQAADRGGKQDGRGQKIRVER